jgi:HlyD family secretion protein
MKETKSAHSPKLKILRILVLLLVIAAIVGVRTHMRMVANSASKNTVTASGTIEAIEMDISPRVAGRIVTLAVDEGDRVKKGQVIAVLDDSELVAQVNQAQGALATTHAKLADLLAGSREEQIRQARANYEKALASARGSREVYGTVSESHYKSSELKANLALAESTYKAAVKEREAAAARLALVREGPRKEEIDRLKANLDQARAQLRNAEADYKRYAQLYKEGAVSGQQLDSALAARDSLKGAAEAVEAKYTEALAGSRPEEIREAEAKLAQADAKLVGAKESLAAYKQMYVDRLGSRQQVESAKSTSESAAAQVRAAKAELDLLMAGATKDVIEAARGQVEQAKGALDAAKTKRGYTTIVAPADGVVNVKFRELGEYVSPGTPIVKIASLDRVWLRVYAPLPTLGSIKVGQSASVRADTYPGKTYSGRVSSISEEPEFTPKNVQTTEERVKLVYAVRIDLDNKSQELKPGMPADADIRLTKDAARR